MKKIILILLLLCMAMPAQADEVPGEALALCEQLYPGCQTEAWYGWADGETGQLLMALKVQDGYVLCMTEKRAGEDWRLTLNAANALRDDLAPDLFLDSDGDTLFFSYWEDERLIRYSASRAATGGQWGMVSAIVYEDFAQWTVGAANGAWYCCYYLSDENDNILEEKEYPRIQMDEGWEESLHLENYQAGNLPLPDADWQ